jgi:Zn-dependent peptidase ImmA (M78 family)
MRVDVKPELLHWACDRAAVPPERLAGRFPRLDSWLRGETSPTLKQLETFAKATHAPIGFFFLPEPPAEELPIPDFRTVAGRAVRRPSADLLDTIYLCQRRQEWFREWAQITGERPFALFGSFDRTSDPSAVGARLRAKLGLDLDDRSEWADWEAAQRSLIERAEQLGVLVMVSGVVGNNTARPLDPEEFRGFALADDLAPLIFVNGADAKAAQMFTLAHELAHLLLGTSALSNVDGLNRPRRESETWCNAVAAELLVPADTLRENFDPSEERDPALTRLGRQFKVSRLVLLRRLRDIDRLSQAEFLAAYRSELARLAALPRGNGGNFYRTEATRTGKRFLRALIVDTLEGNTLYQDAMRLLGVSGSETVHHLAQSLGVI